MALIEAELKARVADPRSVRALLRAAAGKPEVARYEDTYFDRDNELTAGGRELRVRTIITDVAARTLLTYKGPVLDQATGSKSETETVVEDRPSAEAILNGLGFMPRIEFVKNCENYRLTTLVGRSVLATLVTVAELDETFLEVETMVPDETEMRAALDDLRTMLLDLEIGPGSLTTELYTDAVAARRRT